MGECIGDVDERGPEPKRPARGDLPDEEVPRILLRGEARRERTQGWLVLRRRRLAVQEGVGTLLVVFLSERIERPLLGRQIGPRGTNGPAPERAMHAFVRAVLLRAPRMNALMLNAEAHPPDVEIRAAVNGRGGEGHAVVRANGPGEAVGVERAPEDRPGQHAMRRADAVAGQQKAGVLVREREGKAEDPVLRGELALEVNRPEIVRVVRRGGHDAGMLVWAAPTPRRHQPFPREQVAGGNSPCHLSANPVAFLAPSRLAALYPSA